MTSGRIEEKEIADHGPVPEMAVLLSEQRKQVLDAMAALSPLDKELVYRRYFGFSLELKESGGWVNQRDEQTDRMVYFQVPVFPSQKKLTLTLEGSCGGGNRSLGAGSAGRGKGAGAWSLNPTRGCQGIMEGSATPIAARRLY